jgi:beta-phosphoglucomutase-like phosphatase (HAD superfamily)
MTSVIKAIFWDLDGTLIDSELIHEQAAFFATRELGFVSTVEIIPAGLENSAVFELMIGQALNLDNQHLFARWEQLVIEHALARISPHQQIKQSLELFNYFAKLGLPQAVVSNSTAPIVRHSLQQLGILERCSQIFSRDSVEFGKPHPQLYLNALEFHQLLPSQCLSFEDSRSGIMAAQTCGINVIGIGANTRQYAPDLVCDLEQASWLTLIQSSFNCG